MAILEKVTNGRVAKPISCLIYGTDGVGKTSFAACAPNPLFLGAESGTAQLDVHRLEITSATEFTQALTELLGEHKYETLVVDSLDWLEPLIWGDVCKNNNWSHIDEPGYGKGYAAALAEWEKIKHLLVRIREERKMNVILIAHAQIRTFQDPTSNVGYDRYQLKLNEKAAALLRELVDDVLFANYVTFARAKKEGAKGVALGDGSRKIYTERRPGFDAKNRNGLPFELPLSWDDYFAAVRNGNKAIDPKEIERQITELLPQIKNEKALKGVKARLSAANGNVDTLIQLKNKVIDYVGSAA